MAKTDKEKSFLLFCVYSYPRLFTTQISWLFEDKKKLNPRDEIELDEEDYKFIAVEIELAQRACNHIKSEEKLREYHVLGNRITKIKCALCAKELSSVDEKKFWLKDI